MMRYYKIDNSYHGCVVQHVCDHCSGSGRGVVVVVVVVVMVGVGVGVVESVGSRVSSGRG